MSLIDRVWSNICKCYPTVAAYNECVINGFTYTFKHLSPNEISLMISYNNLVNDFGVVFKSVVNDKEHSPCVTMTYPPKDKYEFIHVQHPVGTLGTSLLGDYKEWSDDEIKDWMEGMLVEYGKLASWRIWVSRKFKELESSLMEPDWNIVAAITKDMKTHADMVFTPGNATCEDSPKDERA